MSNRKTFEITRQVTIELPINLVCRENGYMDKFEGGKWVPGHRFCDIGKSYVLTEVRECEDGSPEFVVMTDTVLDDDTVVSMPHYMGYDFMVKYFHVIF